MHFSLSLCFAQGMIVGAITVGVGYTLFMDYIRKQKERLAMAKEEGSGSSGLSNVDKQWKLGMTRNK